jgi:ferrous iron transport protein A
MSEQPDVVPLSELKPGTTGVVDRLTIEGEQRRRLLDLGLIPGTVIHAEFISPLGDPTSYRIRGALIALRNDQAQQILVRRS